MEKRQALGKGLSALIPEAVDTLAPRESLEVDIDWLRPNDLQPRAQMQDARLDELAESIRAHGVIQPIVVRRLASGHFQIIAGERRWRAARRAGLHKVPVFIKDLPQHGTERLEMALIENIQREDLNAIEEATAYQRLAHEFGLRQEDIASRVGKDRSSIANSLRLLKLPEEVRAEIVSGRLSMGHARAIVSLAGEADQCRLAREVLARGLSVRETESLVKRTSSAPSRVGAREGRKKDVHTRAAEEQLHLALGTRVEIKRRGKGGFVAIAFANENELQRIYEYLVERR